jgi:hypothetical protein
MRATMLVNYKFKVDGQVLFDKKQLIPISVDEFTMEFIVDKVGLLTHISVVSRIPVASVPKNNKPQLELQEQILNDSRLKKVKHKIKGLESIFSLWANFRSIDTDVFEINWIIEHEKERDPNNLTTLRSIKEGVSFENLEVFPFDIAARSILICDQGHLVAIANTFLRKGNRSFSDEEYIEAIYYFYLVFETMFGDGKFKGVAVKKAYSNSAELKRLFNQVISEPLQEWVGNDLMDEFLSHPIYKSLDFDKFFGHFVDLRGYLHHHSLKNPNAWDPSKPSKYAIDAAVMAQLAYTAIFKSTYSLLDSEAVKKEFLKQSENTMVE